MPCQRLDIISKNLSKNPKLDMTTNSKVLLAIILLTEYGYMILNKKKSHTVTNSAQNGLDHSRSIQYYKMMHIDFVHWITLSHYLIYFTARGLNRIWKEHSYSQ